MKIDFIEKERVCVVKLVNKAIRDKEKSNFKSTKGLITLYEIQRLLKEAKPAVCEMPLSYLQQSHVKV